MEQKKIYMIAGGALSIVVIILALVALYRDQKPETAIDLQEGYYTDPATLVNYRMEEKDGKKIMTDGECLIYLSGENPTLSKNWQKDSSTEKIGTMDFNVIRYRENTHIVRMDGHALSSNVRVSLDNPAGFAHCVTDFQKLLEEMGKSK